MVAVWIRDWYDEAPVAEDDEPDPVDSADVLSGDNAGDAIEAEANAPAAPAADTDGGGDGPLFATVDILVISTGDVIYIIASGGSVSFPTSLMNFYDSRVGSDRCRADRFGKKSVLFPSHLFLE